MPSEDPTGARWHLVGDRWIRRDGVYTLIANDRGDGSWGWQCRAIPGVTPPKHSMREGTAATKEDAMGAAVAAHAALLLAEAAAREAWMRRRPRAR